MPQQKPNLSSKEKTKQAICLILFKKGFEINESKSTKNKIKQKRSVVTITVAYIVIIYASQIGEVLFEEISRQRFPD